MKRLTTLLVAATLAGATTLAFAQDIKIAHIYGKTGALEAYAKQTQAGLMLGLEYATGGSMAVLGRKIVIIEKDDQIKPDVAKSALAAASVGDDSAAEQLVLARFYAQQLLPQVSGLESATTAGADDLYAFEAVPVR